MRVDIYLTNLGKKIIAVGMTSIAPGKTEKILQKDFERKASYIDRMIKEKKLSFGNSGNVSDSTPATDVETEASDNGTSNESAVVTDEVKAGEEDNDKSKDTDKKLDEADASDAKDEDAEKEEDEGKLDNEPALLETILAPELDKK